MKTFEEMAKTYFDKPTLLERITELEPSCYGDIELIVRQEVLKQEHAIKGHLFSRINDLERNRKKLLKDSNSKELSEKARLIKVRKAEGLMCAIKELRFLMLSNNGKLKRDSSYPRL